MTPNRVLRRRVHELNVTLARGLGFHVFASDESGIYATRNNSRAEMRSISWRAGLMAPAGLTLYAPSVPAMRRKLLRWRGVR